MFLASPGEISVPSVRSSKVFIILVLRNDYSFKPNNTVVDVTRNLRNLRPTFELREQWQYNNQVRPLAPRLSQ